MRVLEISNIIMPAMSRAMGQPATDFGGWIYSSFDEMRALDDISFAFATVYPGNEFIVKEIDNVKYYLLPLCGKPISRYHRHLEDIWLRVKNDFQPDVVNIHGSEYPHGLAWVRSCGNKGVLVSIQGIASEIEKCCKLEESPHFLTTFRDIVRRDSIKQSRNEFARMAEKEKELFQSVRHVAGRTDWDHSHVKKLNPDLEYHYCGETMRRSFYKHKWNYANCQPHSIFVSQSYYPIKGLHKLLQALPEVLRHYPDTQVFVAGTDETSKPWWRITGYGKYLRRLIKRYSLEHVVAFTGLLSEKQMLARYLDSNIFLCCSSVENSSNSIGEAQLLGMPILASEVGGNPQIMKGHEDCLYPFADINALSEKICGLFAKTDLERMPVKYNLDRFSSQSNLKTQIGIYRAIANEGQSGESNGE